MYERLRDGAREYQRAIDWRRQQQRRQQQPRQQQQPAQNRHKQPPTPTDEITPDRGQAAAADEPEVAVWEKRWERGKEAKRLLVVLGREVARRLGALVTATGAPAPQWDALVRAWPEIERRWDELDRELAAQGATEPSPSAQEAPSAKPSRRRHKAGEMKGQSAADDGSGVVSQQRMPYAGAELGLENSRKLSWHSNPWRAGWAGKSLEHLGVLPGRQGKNGYGRQPGPLIFFPFLRSPTPTLRVVR
jgi:hypothetical protein